MRFCESRWAYFMAFGLPSTAVSYFHPSGLVNLMLFMLVFPIVSDLSSISIEARRGGCLTRILFQCTVLAMLASPQPRVAPSTSAAFSPAATTPAVALSPFLPGRLPIFWPTVKLYRRIVRAFPNSAEAPSASLGARGWKDINRRPSFEPANGGVARQSAAAQFVGGAWGSAQPNGASAGAAWGSPQLGAGRWASPQLGGGQWASAGTAGIGSPGRPPSYVQSSQPAADFGPPPTASANRGPPPRAKAGGKKQD